MKSGQIKTVTLGGPMDLDHFIAVARYGAEVKFSEEYCRRVNLSRQIVEQWIEEKRIVYGTTTGFGSLCTEVIGPEQTALLQEYLILSDCTSVGEPLTEEQSRAVMLMVLQNVGQGYSGCRLEVLERYRDFLNAGLSPWAPREGSVGYLSVEAHMAYVLLGGGRAYFQGELLEGAEALKRAGIEPLTLRSKEGLALISGTTSPTALAALAIQDMLKAAKAADIIAAMSLEALQGLIRAFDERVMLVRPHREQADTAENVRRILADSEVIEKAAGSRLQDAMSLRCVPQLHGAAKSILKTALATVETEMNSCCDNPIVWGDLQESEAISACNADSSYVGIALDACAIAATNLAKMSERRNNRLIDGSLSGYPWFLVENPGLNCGLMLPQYVQAGLLNDMKILSCPATVDCIPTCGNQEDYVAMGYNACKKAVEVAEKLEYILAIELLSVFEAQRFFGKGMRRSPASASVLEYIGQKVPVIKDDIYLHPHIEFLRQFVHDGELIDLVEAVIGELK